MAFYSHKYRGAMGALAAVLVLNGTAVGQVLDERPVVSSGQAVSLVGAGAVLGTAILLDRASRPAECAPCSPNTIPIFDRWAVGAPRPDVSLASDVLALSLAGASLLDTGRRDGGESAMIVSLEAVAWTFAVTQVSKALIGRLRPVMFTDRAAAVRDEVSNQRSMPSGHAAVAFAFAASYWANASDTPAGPKIAAMLAAAGVGALRVAAGKHFPSDVVVGALLGTASAVILHEIRY
jgi:hypothetical protein